jgi:hypothetical protein
VGKGTNMSTDSVPLTAALLVRTCTELQYQSKKTVKEGTSGTEESVSGRPEALCYHRNLVTPC